MTIGDRVKELRERNDMTQQEKVIIVRKVRIKKSHYITPLQSV